MDPFSFPFLREHNLRSISVWKRVLTEGSGLPISSTSTIKIHLKIYRCSDFSTLDLPPHRLFTISSEQLFDPSSRLSIFQQVLISMRPSEESLFKILAGSHQEPSEAWEDLWYRVTVVAIEPIEALLPSSQSFLREHSIGPNKTLKKRVVIEGTGLTPEFNTLVTYYYSVQKEDGSVFEAYSNKSHVLGKVPSQDTSLAIYYALITMRETEESLVFAPADFVKKGYKRNLWISIHLLYINKCEDPLFPQELPFLEESDLGCGVVKRVLKEGDGEVLSNVGKIWVETEGWLEDSFKFQKMKAEVFSNTKEQKNKAISQILLLKTMKVNEVSLIKCPPGTHIYPDALEAETVWLKYRVVEYLEVLPDLGSIKSFEERLKKCSEILDIGNRIYKSGIRSESKTVYNKVNSALILKSETINNFSAQEKAAYFKTKSRVLNNLALVHLKDAEEGQEKELIEKNLKKVIEYCKEDLEIFPSNVKSVYRKGKANFLKKNFEEAKSDLERLLGEEPKNREGLELMRKIEKNLKIEENRAKIVFKGVFNNENWEKQAEEDEERIRSIEEKYSEITDEEQGAEVLKWVAEINKKNLSELDAINLLLI